jgi:hypothetical protein
VEHRMETEKKNENIRKILQEEEEQMQKIFQVPGSTQSILKAEVGQVYPVSSNSILYSCQVLRNLFK